MNNPNPFVPKGSLLEQQSKRRSRLKFGVLCVLALGITGLAAMLIQGCKREEDQNSPESDNNPPAVDTNTISTPDTNSQPMEASNTPAGTAPEAGQQVPPATAAAPTAPPPAPAVPVAPAPSENEYVVVKGDYMAKIARENGVTLKALEDANPNVQPTRLHIGQKLVIPAGASATGANAAGETAAGVAANGDVIHVVKSGETLGKIAHHYGVTVKAIENENNLTTTKIKVGQKLQIPAKPEAGQAPVNAPPATTTAPESTPAPANNPAPTQQNAPPQQ